MKAIGLFLLIVALYVCVFCDDNKIEYHPRNRPPRCRQPIDTGDTSCHYYENKFAFDAYEEQCVRFNYTGCGGNSNRFDTLRECLRNCD